ncbi:MAG: phosphate uptake regulator PhoU [Candidatus Methanomethylophilaceae archaeon]
MIVEIRKIQITGGSSFMVTLPKDWAESAGIKKNDPVSLEPQPDGSLLISTGKQTDGPKSVKTIKACDDQLFLYRQLIGAYISGHREIEIVSESRLSGSITETVSNFTQTAIGLEIVEESEKQILVKDLMDHTKMIPRKSIERMKVLVSSMLKDTLSFEGDVSVLSNMDQRDTEVDRINWLVSRQVNIYLRDLSMCRKMEIAPYEIAGYRIACRTMERIGDHAVTIAKNIVKLSNENKVPKDRAVDAVCGDIIMLFENSLDSLLKKDMVRAEECIELSGKTVDSVKKVFKKTETDPDIASPISTIAASARRITEYCADISEHTINVGME